MPVQYSRVGDSDTPPKDYEYSYKDGARATGEGRPESRVQSPDLQQCSCNYRRSPTIVLYSYEYCRAYGDDLRVKDALYPSLASGYLRVSLSPTSTREEKDSRDL